MRRAIRRERMKIERGDLVIFNGFRYLVTTEHVGLKSGQTAPYRLLDIDDCYTIDYDFKSIEEIRNLDGIKLLAKSQELVLKIAKEII
ncbi:MAG: hypothetical protein E7H33_09560 [Clostridium perfringens]|nr:hypothetical protein [Clostridium perfringens]